MGYERRKPVNIKKLLGITALIVLGLMAATAQAQRLPAPPPQVCTYNPPLTSTDQIHCPPGIKIDNGPFAYSEGIAWPMTVQDSCTDYLEHIQLIVDQMSCPYTGRTLVDPSQIHCEENLPRLVLYRLSQDAPTDQAQCAALDKQLTALDIPGKLHLVPVHLPTREEQSEQDMQELVKAIGGAK